MFFALTDKPSEEREDAVIGINAVTGSMKDLVTLFNNINGDIKKAAMVESMLTIMMNKEKKNEEK